MPRRLTRLSIPEAVYVGHLADLVGVNLLCSAPAHLPTATPCSLRIAAGLPDRGRMPGDVVVLGWQPPDAILSWLPRNHSASLLLYHLLPVALGLTNISNWRPALGPLLGAVADKRRRADPAGGRRCVPRRDRAIRRADGLLLSAWGMAETCTGITWSRYDPQRSVHRVHASEITARAIRRSTPSEVDPHLAGWGVVFQSPETVTFRKVSFSVMAHGEVEGALGCEWDDCAGQRGCD
jgi:hypothetical protein